MQKTFGFQHNSNHIEMKKINLLFILIGLSVSVLGQDLDDFINQANSFFIQHVHQGQVDYGKAQESKGLKDLVATIKTFDFSKLDENKKKAYFINVYNLLVINQITEHWPTSSPMNINGFFDNVKQNIGGNSWTLSYLENKVMRPTFKDARLHFVLVCGAKSCPPIINEAYFPSTLEIQLEEQTKAALNNPNFIKTEGAKTLVSEIFKWYESDFKLKSKNVTTYINTYRENKITGKIAYYSYDWSVNGMLEQTKGQTQLEKKTKFNLQTYNTGSLLQKGRFDFSMFNSMYTQSKSNWMGVNYSGTRETFLSTLFQFTYGTSKNARFNLGIDFKLAASGKSTSSSKFSTVSRVLKLTNTDTTRVGLAYVGPRIKIQPFKSEPNFTMQSSVLVPTTPSSEGKSADENGNGALAFLEWDRIQWWTQFFFVKSFKKAQLFLEADLWYRIGYKKNQATALDVPLTLIYSYFPTPKTTFYALASHSVRNQYNPNNYSDAITSANNDTSAGLGFKYKITSKLNLELLYTNFLRGVNSGLGNTFNVGFRYVY